MHVIENGEPLKLGDISATNKESPTSSSLAIAKELQFGHLISILMGDFCDHTSHELNHHSLKKCHDDSF
ncbi:hypothetical protein PULV_a1337 [Pseudoalteromonas ulvae UL12]|nr:hypothetical protein [Pseudoalteromonas ulvae UL12]